MRNKADIVIIVVVISISEIAFLDINIERSEQIAARSFQYNTYAT